MKIKRIINKVIATSLSLVIGISSTYAVGKAVSSKNLKEKVSKSQRMKEETKKRWINNSILLFLASAVAGTVGTAIWADIAEGKRIKKGLEKSPAAAEEEATKEVPTKEAIEEGPEEEMREAAEERIAEERIAEEKVAEEKVAEERIAEEKVAEGRNDDLIIPVVSNNGNLGNEEQKNKAQVDKIIDELKRRGIKQDSTILQQTMDFGDLFDQVVFHMSDIEQRMNVKMDLKQKYSLPLTWAVSYRGIDTVRELLKRVDVNEKDASGKSALLYAIEGGIEKIDVFNLLLDQKNIDLNAKIRGETLLIHSVVYGNLAAFERLLNENLNVDEQNEKGETALMRSTIPLNRSKGMFEILLRRNANIDIKDNQGKTALIWAIENRRAPMVELLISKGAMKSNGYKYDNLTPLQYAVKNYKWDSEAEIEIIGLLLNEQLLLNEEVEKDTLNAICKDRCRTKNFLVKASKNNRIKIIENLLKLDSIKDFQQEWSLAFAEAVKNKNIDIIKLIINKEDDINWLFLNDKDWGWGYWGELVALRYAVHSKEKEIVKIVLDKIKEGEKPESCINYVLPDAIESGLDEEAIDLFLEFEDIDTDMGSSSEQLRNAVCFRGKWIKNRLENYKKKWEWEDNKKIWGNAENSEGEEIDQEEEINKEMEKIKNYRKGDSTHDFEILRDIMQEENIGLFQKVLNNIEDINVNAISNDKDETILTYAIQNSPIKMLKLLLNHSKINPNMPNKSGQTPLYFAVDVECIDAIKLLLSHPQIDANLANCYEYIPLVRATSLLIRDSYIGVRKAEIFKLLINHSGIDINPRKSLGIFSPFIYISGQGRYKDLVKLLMDDRRIDINDNENYAKVTALMQAAALDDKDVVELLLSHPKINVNMKDKGGKTALDYAQFMTYPILKAHGAKKACELDPQ